jgi:hypothetical protein
MMRLITSNLQPWVSGVGAELGCTFIRNNNNTNSAVIIAQYPLKSAKNVDSRQRENVLPSFEMAEYVQHAKNLLSDKAPGFMRLASTSGPPIDFNDVRHLCPFGLQSGLF